jgi:replication-associated recombination protein RarA
MAISLSSLKSTKRNDPPSMLLYGVDGVGKTSLAAEFPKPDLSGNGRRAAAVGR